MRDRATLYLARLDGRAGGPEAVDVHWGLPAKNLEKALRAHLDSGSDAPFDLVRPPACAAAQPQIFPAGFLAALGVRCLVPGGSATPVHAHPWLQGAALFARSAPASTDGLSDSMPLYEFHSQVWYIAFSRTLAINLWY